MGDGHGPGDKVRGLLASDVYSQKGRLRADDLLVRERVGRGLGEATARIRALIRDWRADRVPPSTREQPFPPPEAMEPIRRAERLIRAIDETSAIVRGLPLLNQDKVWDRVRRLGLDELLQFDWTLVGEADALADGLRAVAVLDEIDGPAVEARLRKIREVIADRRRYLEIQA
ncbi:MAG TPA: hypothetical protein VMI33_20500 [Streptosporangiaceae bacterium]|nr:hypothetical protein [Streptosporangiaceae bacterium]